MLQTATHDGLHQTYTFIQTRFAVANAKYCIYTSSNTGNSKVCSECGGVVVVQTLLGYPCAVFGLFPQGGSLLL